MKTTMNIQVRAFPVVIRDERTGGKLEDQIVLELNQIKAADAMGLDFEEAIYHQYNQMGYRVLEIGKAHRQTITLNLEELYRLHSAAALGQRGAQINAE